MYKQVYDPIAGSLGWSSLVAAVLLVGLRMKAQWAALISLGVSIVVAIAAYGMPAGQAFDSAAEGAAFGLFPIMWIVVNAIWVYNMTVESGHFAVLRRSFGAVSDDQRVQSVIIAFSFGALMEALAGFGTPVAITAVMLIALGFRPIKAAAVALVANTAPVAFGAIATPIITLAQTSGLPKTDLGSMVGRQTPFLALIVPLILVFMVDGRRGVRQAWPAALVGGVAFAVGQFVSSNYVSVELTDIIASLVSAGSIVALLRVWKPSEPLLAEDHAAGASGVRPAVAGAGTPDPALERDIGRPGGDSRAEIFSAYAPYLIIIVVFAVAQITWLPIKDALEGRTVTFHWPGLEVLNAKGQEPKAAMFKFNWLSAAGTLLLVSGLVTMPVIRVGLGRALRAYGATLDQLKWAILTVAAVLALAYVMNFSGETITLGQWLAGAGGLFAFLSSILGWLGVAVTGSDTSSNALFGALQVKAAQGAHLSPTLMAAANSSGGV